MDIINPGKEYALANFGETGGTQVVRFTSKDSAGKFTSGTTNEEIVNMMIDRMYALNKQNFSPENQCTILLLKNIRQLQKKRLSRKVDKVIKYQSLNGEH